MEYRVKRITRYIVTKYQEPDESSGFHGRVDEIGTFTDVMHANNCAYGLYLSAIENEQTSQFKSSSLPTYSPLDECKVG